MIQLSVKCPKCSKLLNDKEHLIDMQPSIKIKLAYAGKNGPLYMSSLFGSYEVKAPFEVPLGKIAGFRCPHCDRDLKTTRKCEVCASEMVGLELIHGGHVQICARRGCKKHLLEFSDVETELAEIYRSYINKPNH